MLYSPSLGKWIHGYLAYHKRINLNRHPTDTTYARYRNSCYLNFGQKLIQIDIDRTESKKKKIAESTSAFYWRKMEYHDSSKTLNITLKGANVRRLRKMPGSANSVESTVEFSLSQSLH